MEIKTITKKENIYTVVFTPNLIERIFGIKEKSKKFKKTYNYFYFGGGCEYVNEDGKTLKNHNWIGESIDNWERKF